MTRWLVLLFLLVSLPAAAAPLGVDDFEDLTTQGWHVPDPTHPAPPMVIPTGGPAGADDAFLQLSAFGGNGPGSRLSVLNLSQWTGDFTDVGAIGMDVNNLGPSEVVLRLLFVNFPDAPGPPTDVAWTLAPITVSAGSGWTPVLFSLSPLNLIAPFGSVGGALADVDELRIFHSVAPAFGGPGIGSEPVVATVGVDNIQVVPEPSTLVLLLSGLGVAARKKGQTLFRKKRV